MLKNKRTESLGITLIALVVSIIVLLVLAGVNLSMLTGQNGVLIRAVEAKEKTQQANEKEKGTPVDFSVNIALEYLRTYFYMFVLFRLFFLDRFFRGNSEVFFISVAEVFYIFQSDHFRYGSDRVFPAF